MSTVRKNQLTTVSEVRGGRAEAWPKRKQEPEWPKRKRSTSPITEPVDRYLGLNTDGTPMSFGFDAFQFRHERRITWQFDRKTGLIHAIYA